MKIVRDDRSYELTPEELEQAYREQERNYRLADAARQLANYYGEEINEPWEAEAAEAFRRELGCSFEAACDPNCPDYLLDAIVEGFEDNFDCNVDENQQFETAIQRLIQSHQERLASGISL